MNKMKRWKVKLAYQLILLIVFVTAGFLTHDSSLSNTLFTISGVGAFLMIDTVVKRDA
ncbi:hypothetical protein [Bacillus sp. CGMCC 1.16541]|uniref:hypothetical protein n=1 Tax=Bacillus sp. CGMCC 1.16541 TaxID=2185143 RepID=UPI0013A551B9|nr:hypothetical protein [Bacillus sp. CGMCC 1.16541]